MFSGYTVGIGLWNAASQQMEALLGIQRSYPGYVVGWQSLSGTFAQWEPYPGLPESDTGVYLRIERSPDDTFGYFLASYRQTPLDAWTPFSYYANYTDFNASLTDTTLQVRITLYYSTCPLLQ
jgi:hypothetical protein